MNSNRTKHILQLIVAAFMTINSIAYGNDLEETQPATKDEKCVIIDFEKPIENYKVRVYWRPHEVMAGHLIGPAILEFTHKDQGKSFSVTNDRFGLPDTEDWVTRAVIDGGYYVRSPEPHLTLPYKSPEIVGLLPSTCFFFADLNYDNKMELIVTEVANGQRFRNTYRVYDPHRTYLRELNREPYLSLDSQSIINFKNRSIHLFDTVDGKLGLIQYNFDEKEGQYVLEK